MLPLKEARVTYPYGVQDSSYDKGYHTGIDLVSAETSVFAAVPGMVLEARFAPGRGADPSGWGNYVILRTTSNKYDLIYAHLAGIQAQVNQIVNEGTVLGKMGSTGNSTGLHLHFEVRVAPWANRNDLDPAAFLGIYNRLGPVESIPGDNTNVDSSKKIKNIIICNAGPDERAAGYLADFLKAPVVLQANATQELLDYAQNIYVIGNADKKAAQAVYIVGSNRYETCQKVIAICLGK